MIKVFFHTNQSAQSNSSFSPSAQKPEQVVQYWQDQKQPIKIMSFDPATVDEIAKVHDRKYVKGVLTGKIANGFGNTSKDVAFALPWVVGSMVSASLYAFKNRENTFSPTSGAHHARYSRGGGFCTFNHLVVSAVKAHEAGAKTVGIIDLDCHYGDGTDNIIDKLNLDFIHHYTFGKRAPAKGAEVKKWLKELPKLLECMKNCDLLIFNAGVDPHVNDPLGGVLTTDEMYQRDLLVYQFAKQNDVPIVTSLAGGYQRTNRGDITPVLELHNNTMNAYREVFENLGGQNVVA